MLFRSVVLYTYDASSDTLQPQATGTQTERYDVDETTIYVGSAKVGTSDSATGWTIIKYDISDLTDASGKVATNVSWNNRTTGSYA